MSATTRGVVSVAGSTAGGLLLLAAGAAWWAISALEAGTSPAAASGMILAAGATLGLCWVAAARWPAVVLTALVGGAAVVVASDAGATLASGPRQGPFGYANATAAFLAQACVAALMLTVVARGPLRLGAAVATIGFASIVLVTRSWTAAIALPFVLGAALVAERWRGGRAALALCAGLFVAALVTTIALGAWGDGDANAVIERTISEDRVALWNDALSITAEHPLLGVGPGGFARASATASSDADLRWAHQEFLQAGAETGLVGYAIAVGIFLWGFVALGQGSPGRVAVLAGGALAILGIHASVDYVLHFPFVALAGAAVLGAGLGATRGVPARVPPFVPGRPVREVV